MTVIHGIYSLKEQVDEIYEGFVALQSCQWIVIRIFDCTYLLGYIKEFNNRLVYGKITMQILNLQYSFAKKYEKDQSLFEFCR